MSNVEAARVLLTDHDYNVNILLYEKNFMYDLLNTSGFEDFSILPSLNEFALLVSIVLLLMFIISFDNGSYS